MPRRLGPTPQAVPSPAPQHHVAVRTKGLQLLATLQPVSLERITSIDTPEGYLEMDKTLGEIRNVRAQWRLTLQPIRGPLDVAIQKQKEALAAAKKAAEGVDHLDKEVSLRIDRLEQHAKKLMADYKAAEARQLREAEEQTRQEATRLREEAARRSLQAASAKTPQLRARLEQQRADLEARAATVETEAAVAQPVKGAASTPRTQRKVKVVDIIRFLHAVTDYEPTGGVYAMGKPPLRTTDKNGLEALLVEVVQARLNDLFREQPGVVESWPGVEVYDDITIAGR